jgi:hypothetical protein
MTLNLVEAHLLSGQETAGLFGDIGMALIPFIKELSEEFKIGVKDLIEAFKNKELFKLLRAIKFNLGTLVKAVTSAGKMINASLRTVFKQIEQHEWIQKLKKGVIKVDDLINQYPIFKKITGPVLAGLLLLMWIKMSFIGDFEYDFDMTDIVNAIKGNYSIYDLLTTAEGLQNLTLFILGAATGLSFVWLVSHAGLNILMGLLYTQYKHTGKPKFAKQFVDRMKSQAAIEYTVKIKSPTVKCKHKFMNKDGKVICAECGASPGDYFKNSGYQYAAPIWTPASVKSATLKAIKDLNKYRRDLCKKEMLDPPEYDVPTPEDWKFTVREPKVARPTARPIDQASISIVLDSESGVDIFKYAITTLYFINNNLYGEKSSGDARMSQLQRLPNEIVLFKYLVSKFTKINKGSDDDFSED